jgi:NitT/TauT family transport system substrate-binding protein
MAAEARRTIAAALALLIGGATTALAEKIRIGVLLTSGAGPMFIARDKGYFAREGLDAEIISFDNSQTLAVSIASGDLDFGATSLSIGFYNLASRGFLRIISAQGRDAPGFPNNGAVVSLSAWQKGLRSYRDLPGHSMGLPTQGSGPHYAAGLIADKYGFPLSKLDIQWTKSSANLVALMASNRVDAGVTPSITALSMEKNGQAKILGWVGDETPWQLGAAYTSADAADRKRETVEKFLRAYKAGMRDYHDAFTTPDGKRRDNATPTTYSPSSRRLSTSPWDCCAPASPTSIAKPASTSPTSGARSHGTALKDCSKARSTPTR